MTKSKNNHSKHAASKSWIVWMCLLIVLTVIAAAAALYWQYRHHNKPKPIAQQTLSEVKSVANLEKQYDVIVVGTDPEGVTAAVSAARNGQKTLLVDGHDREILGGLMTLGWLNSIDMNYVPNPSVLNPHDVLNKGLFSEWYSKIEGDSFSINTAANAFYDMVRGEKNIDLMLKLKSIEPLLSNQGQQTRVEGITLTKEDGTKQEIRANAVIDATQDGDIAAAAGVPFTYGLEDLGNKNAKMAVTLVFKLKNVTPDVWSQISKHLKTDDDPMSDANEVSAWGYKELYNYPALNPERVKMRGLNIGRQDGDMVLINALQIFNIDGLDAKSRAEAFEIAKKEIPNVVAFLKKNYPEFAGVELAGTAPELYVRETRHIQGEYRLNIIDLLENRDQWDRIAFGSYPVDIQRLAPTDTGMVVTQPEQYAIPFRSIVPKKVDGLLVIGRAASYDTLPHGSARVIPVGMAEGQAAGAAAKLAKDAGLSFRELAASKENIAKLQDMLNKQGVDLKPFSMKPQPFMTHKQYEGLKAAVSMSLVGGGYKNEFELDKVSNPQRMVNYITRMKKIIPSAYGGDPSGSLKGIDEEARKKSALTLDQAAYTMTQGLGIAVPKEGAMAELSKRGIVQESSLATIKDKQNLTNGDTFMLIMDLHKYAESKGAKPAAS
ncbi:FAD-dependent oxidoreductase [Paenibacillus chitinolyticus]|uniref:FAD-dependent oxidoreductase n=1 Tax=Paenibacillus chitinolyticus TaxID=79263 RepID=A0A410X1X0_9BACL|nr:FAD-dependent oxidoreductase [Paenibacillus chitinolyticus]MCY9592698.1 FAD-dependent oxidoreductase [Paenibacillus chitinolyticus]MCY9594699.1 FAD-dependent oxidoreductase [Paenibacillus chitinolyticus]QAV20609.1 FAD-dependent oxidoreductase [Paenibacillus chitinolyticus]